MRGLCGILLHSDVLHVEERDTWPGIAQVKRSSCPRQAPQTLQDSSVIFSPPAGTMRGKLPLGSLSRLGVDTEALVDSGSMVTLVRPEFAGPLMGREISVSCIHGVTRNYPTAEISMVTPRGQFRVRTGVVECLPIPVLVGRLPGLCNLLERPSCRREDTSTTPEAPFVQTPTYSNQVSTDAEAISPEEYRGDEVHSDSTATASEDIGGAQVHKDL